MGKNKTDRTWGIDRSRSSDTFGKLVLGGVNMMPIVLWNQPGAAPKQENVTGGLKHNQRVEIIGRTTFNGARFIKVRKTVIHEGKRYPQVGWLSETLLKREGEPTIGQ